MIYRLGDRMPNCQLASYLAPSSTIIGSVTLAKGVTVWPSAVIRADFAPIIVGTNSNIQDNVTVHVDLDVPCIIADNVSIGHNVVLHSCIIESNVIIGMGSIVLNHARVAKNCIVGAGSLITHKSPYEEGCLLMGSPAKIIRKLSLDEIAHIQSNADNYSQKALSYQTSIYPVEFE